jgi:hypothetical protein
MTDDWNENSAGMLHCGWLLCLDESMSRWLSRTKGGDKGIPYSPFVKRKPEPTGTEMKTLADCDTGCILHCPSGGPRGQGGEQDIRRRWSRRHRLPAPHGCLAPANEAAVELRA